MPRAFAVPAATLVAAVAALVPATARAALVISSSPTSGVTCTAGTCTATAADAVLDVKHLEKLLAAGDVVVQSGALAGDVVVSSALAWGGSALTLDAYHSVKIDAAVHANAGASLTLTRNDGGTAGELTFGVKGHVDVRDLASPLVIDGRSYKLVDSVASLAATIAKHPADAIALAASYDASADGTYAQAPVPTTFTGIFEGLGHTISNLAIDDVADSSVALFATLDSAGVLRDLGLEAVNVTAEANTIPNVASLVASSGGAVIQCFATGTVQSTDEATVGGLVGSANGGSTIHASFSEVAVSGLNGSEVGGLIGYGAGVVSDTYATGAVTVDAFGVVGGLIGVAQGPVTASYATGSVSIPEGSDFGGLVGDVLSPTVFTDNYWDTITSGTTSGVLAQNVSGVTGLTTTQLQAALPAGFQASTWAIDPAVNGGLPHLKAAPPH